MGGNLLRACLSLNALEAWRSPSTSLSHPCSWHLLGSIVDSIKRTFSSVEHLGALRANEAVTGTESAVVLILERAQVPLGGICLVRVQGDGCSRQSRDDTEKCGFGEV